MDKSKNAARQSGVHNSINTRPLSRSKSITQNISFWDSNAQAVIDGNYDVIPTKFKSKQPAVSNWTANDRVKDANMHSGKMFGIGVLTSRAPAIDIDARDDVLATEFSEIVVNYLTRINKDCTVLKRQGLAPKVLIPCRLKAGSDLFRKLTSVEFYKDNSFNDKDKNQLEILAEGAFYVAQGIHPNTNRPYQWLNDGRDLTNTSLSELPELDEHGARYLIEQFEILARKLGLVEKAINKPQTLYQADNLAEVDHAFINSEIDDMNEAEQDVLVEVVTSAINFLCGEAGYIEDRSLWIEVGHALACAKGTAVENSFYDLYVKTVCESDNYELDVDRWDGFHPTQTNFKAIFNKAQNRGWINPAKNMSEGFELRPDGVFKLVYNRQTKEYDLKRVCNWCVVEAKTSDVGGSNHGYLIRFKDNNGKIKTLILQSTAIASDIKTIGEIVSAEGIDLAPSGAQYLATYIYRFNTDNQVLCTTKTGWQPCGGFVLPSATIKSSTSSQDIHLTGKSLADKTSIASKGSSEQWYEHIGQFGEHNCTIALSIGIALASPLLGRTNNENGGVNVYGESGAGKTTCINVARSVYGNAEFATQWRATDNGLEAVCEMRNDLLLILDEMNQANPAMLSETIYMIANGKGKARADVRGDARNIKTWRTLVLSSGEATADTYLRQSSKAKDGSYAGVEVRLVNFRATDFKHKVFEHVYNFGDGATFAKHLNASCADYYGSIGQDWLQALVKFSDTQFKEVESRISAFTEQYSMAGWAPQIGRVMRRFGLISAALELAHEVGLLHWKEDPKKIIKRCSDCFLSDWGKHDKNIESIKVIESVASYITRYKDASFDNLSSSHSTITGRERRGFTYRGDGKSGSFTDFNECDEVSSACYYYGFTPSELARICNGQYSHKQIGEYLSQAGLLVTDKGRNQKELRPTAHRRATGDKRVYVIKPNIFEYSAQD